MPGKKASVAHKRRIIGEEAASQMPTNEANNVIEKIEALGFGDGQVLVEVTDKPFYRRRRIWTFLVF